MLKKHDTSASGPDGVAGVRCILLPETTGRRARLTQEWTSGSTGCDCEKGTGEFPDARKGESGNTWDVTNTFIKRLPGGDFVLLYKGLSLTAQESLPQ